MTLTGPALAAYLEYKLMGGTMWLYNKMERNQMFGKFLFASPHSAYRELGFRPWSERENTLTGSQLAAVANKSRQRHKGPLVRFGRKYER